MVPLSQSRNNAAGAVGAQPEPVSWKLLCKNLSIQKTDAVHKIIPVGLFSDRTGNWPNGA
jgi:hypothetical protein